MHGQRPHGIAARCSSGSSPSSRQRNASVRPRSVRGRCSSGSSPSLRPGGPAVPDRRLVVGVAAPPGAALRRGTLENGAPDYGGRTARCSSGSSPSLRHGRLTLDADPAEELAAPPGAALHRGSGDGAGEGGADRRCSSGSSPSSRPALHVDVGRGVPGLAAPPGAALHRGISYSGGMALWPTRCSSGSSPSSRRRTAPLPPQAPPRRCSSGSSPSLRSAGPGRRPARRVGSLLLREQPFIEARSPAHTPDCRRALAAPPGAALHRGREIGGRTDHDDRRLAAPPGAALHRGPRNGATAREVPVELAAPPGAALHRGGTAATRALARQYASLLLRGAALHRGLENMRPRKMTYFSLLLREQPFIEASATRRP